MIDGGPSPSSKPLPEFHAENLKSIAFGRERDYRVSILVSVNSKGVAAAGEIEGLPDNNDVERFTSLMLIAHGVGLVAKEFVTQSIAEANAWTPPRPPSEGGTNVGN